MDSDSNNYLPNIPSENTPIYNSREILYSSQSTQLINLKETNLCISEDNNSDNFRNSINNESDNNMYSTSNDSGYDPSIENFRNTIENFKIPDVVHQKAIELEFAKIPIKQT